MTGHSSFHHMTTRPSPYCDVRTLHSPSPTNTTHQSPFHQMCRSWPNLDYKRTTCHYMRILQSVIMRKQNLNIFTTGHSLHHIVTVTRLSPFFQMRSRHFALFNWVLAENFTVSSGCCVHTSHCEERVLKFSNGEHPSAWRWNTTWWGVGIHCLTGKFKHLSFHLQRMAFSSFSSEDTVFILTSRL